MRKLVLWLARRFGVVYVPFGFTMYVFDPNRDLKVPLYIDPDPEGTVIFGPPPEPNPIPWRGYERPRVEPDPDAPTGSPEFNAAMDLLGKGWKYEGRLH